MRCWGFCLCIGRGWDSRPIQAFKVSAHSLSVPARGRKLVFHVAASLLWQPYPAFDHQVLYVLILPTQRVPWHHKWGAFFLASEDGSCATCTMADHGMAFGGMISRGSKERVTPAMAICSGTLRLNHDWLILIAKYSANGSKKKQIRIKKKTKS